MGDPSVNEPVVLLLFAGVMLFAMLGRVVARRIGLPGMVAFVLIGLGLNAIATAAGGMPASVVVLVEILAKIGVVVLLFQAGMHTDVTRLLDQIGPVAITWAMNVLVAGGFGFLAARTLLDMALIPSLVIAVALTATSVGLSVAVWEEHAREDSRTGRYFLGVAGLDDISAVVLMAILFAVAPVLRGQGDGGIAEVILDRLLWTLAKLVGFGGLCLLFSRYVEHRLRAALQRLESPAAALVSVVAVSIIIAASAGLLGFSVAIGAFFAGLAFSRDPDALRAHIAFDAIYDIFVPFFFIGIGVFIDLTAAGEAIIPGLVLLAAAIAGKLISNGGTALAYGSPLAATALGVSMVPRAEITMIIMQKAHSLGEWAAPQSALAAMVFVSLVTTIVGPPVLDAILKRIEHQESEPEDSA
ncbi:MAG TPA: cation:proton antiporter [Spirochaetia bacterium]|nr:cation:proton antiporter [Spirochaetia bacterium]